MNRSLLICLLIMILSLSFSVQAENETPLEKYWNDYITTTELEYTPEEGEIKLELVSLKYDNGYQKVMYGIIGGYGFEGIEITGYIDGLSFFNDGFDYLDTGVLFGGNVKAQLFDQDGFQLAAKASADGLVNLMNEGMTYDLGLYTDKTLGDNLTLHNNFLCELDDTTIIKRLYNGLSYRFNQYHALKAYLYTGFVEFDSLTNSLNLVYRNDFYDPTTFLSYFRLNEDNLLVANAIELEPVSDLIVTGFYEFNTQENDWVGIYLKKDFMSYRLNGSYNFSEEESLVSGSLAYDLSQDMELKLELDRYVKNDDDKDYVQVRSVVTYSI